MMALGRGGMIKKKKEAQFSTLWPARLGSTFVQALFCEVPICYNGMINATCVTRQRNVLHRDCMGFT